MSLRFLWWSVTRYCIGWITNATESKIGTKGGLAKNKETAKGKQEHQRNNSKVGKYLAEAG